jgi:peptidoglycan/LPS O-acetylase OafA/YrhL
MFPIEASLRPGAIFLVPSGREENRGASSQQSVNLDLLRSVAVTLVLLAHVIRVFNATGNPFVQFWGIQNLGTFGVLMFFIHTSLVLMMSLDRLASTRTAVIPRFYVRRMFRIYPLSVVTVAAVLLLRIPADFEPVYSAPGVKAVWSNLFLVQNISQAPFLFMVSPGLCLE